MQIRTNELITTINYNALFEDFDIFTVEPAKGDLREDTPEAKTRKYQMMGIAKIIRDEMLIKTKALSCSYSGNVATCFLLYKKGEHNAEALNKLVEAKYEGFKVKPLGASRNASLQGTQRLELLGYGDRAIVQLLMNSLANFEGEFRCHNIDAQLMVPDPTNTRLSDDPEKKQYDCRVYLVFSISAGMLLQVDVKTFRAFDPKEDQKEAEDCQKRGKNITFYVRDPKTCELRRALPGDPEEWRRFWEHAFKKKHHTVTYLSFGSGDSFNVSRIGQINIFFKELKRRLGKYLTVTLKEIDAGDSLRPKKARTTEEWLKALSADLKGVPLSLVNLAGDEGKESLGALKAVLDEYGVAYADTQTAELPKCAPAIVVYRPQKWYVHEKKNDPYADLHRQNRYLQGFTTDIDLTGKTGKTVTATLLKELRIKADLLSHRITLPAPLSSLTKPWTFVIAENLNKGKGRKRGPKILRYFALTLKPSGEFTCKTFDDTKLDKEYLDPLRVKIREYFSQKTGNGYLAAGEQLEGICFSDPDNLHRIVHTGLWPLVNFEEFGDFFKRSDPNMTIDKGELLKNMRDFQKVGRIKAGAEMLKVMDEIEADLPEQFLLGKLTLKRQDLSGAKLPPLFLGKSWVKAFSLWLMEEGRAEYLFKGFFKAHGDTLFDYGLDALTDLHVFKRVKPELQSHRLKEDGIAKTVTTYVAGMRSSGLQTDVARSNIFRDIIAEGEDQSEELLPLLDVDFVRTSNMITVLPFPFKYLREYKAMCDFERRGTESPKEEQGAE